MNAIRNGVGVDYQWSRCVVALREGTGIPPRSRSVGDGVRQVIPNPIESATDGTTESEFWRRLAERLYTFLGRVRPVSDNGYEVVVATSGDPDPIGRAAHAAGLTDVSCILPTDALVSRWLVETAGRQTERGLVVAVAIGEAVTTVASYVVSSDARGLPRVGRGPRHELSAGYEIWLPSFFDRVRERLAEVSDVAHDATLFDSAVEFGAKLRAAPSGKTVEWHGPWPERLFEPVRATREECESWAPVRNWMNRVGAQVGDFALGSGGSALSRIIIGGIGAVWPFAADAVARWGKVWQSGVPWLDLAAGAAWWEEARPCFSGDTRQSLPEIPSEAVLALGPGRPTEPERPEVLLPNLLPEPRPPAGDLVLDELKPGDLKLDDPNLEGLSVRDLDLPYNRSKIPLREEPKAPDDLAQLGGDDHGDLPPLDELPPWERHRDPSA